MGTILHSLTTGLAQGQILLSGSSAALGIVNYNDIQANLELSGATNAPLIDAMAGNTTMMLMSGNKIGVGTRAPISTLHLFDNNVASMVGLVVEGSAGPAATGHFKSSSEAAIIQLDADMADNPGGNAEVRFRTKADNNKGFVIGIQNGLQSFVLTTGQNLDIGLPTIKIKDGNIGIRHNNASNPLHISGATNVVGTVTCTGFYVSPPGRGVCGYDVAGELVNCQATSALLTIAGIQGNTKVFISGGAMGDLLENSTANVEFCMGTSGNSNFIIAQRGITAADGALVITTGYDPHVVNPSILIKPADDGKIGINCGSPAALLHISGSPTAALFRVGTGVLHVENGKVGVNMATAAIARHLDISGDLGVTGNIYLTGNIYKNGTAYNNPFTATHKYKEGEFLQPGEAVVLQGGYVYRATVPYDPTCVGLYFQMNGSEEHSVWGNVTNVAEVAALGDNRIYDSEQNLLLGGFRLTKSKGDVKPGDLVTTSDIPGVLQRQNIREFTSGHWIETSLADSTMRSYTVGKVLEPPIWDLSGFAHNVYGYLCIN